MAKGTRTAQHVGTQGWEQFLIARREMLDAFDTAKKKDTAHKVPANAAMPPMLNSGSG